jgi:hypothetical protein
MQFTDSSATLLQYTNANAGTFASVLGAVLPAVGANLIVDAVTPNQGTVAVYAGDGLGGDDNGSLTEASFQFPSDAVFDANGNMYIADSLNNFIRKIDTTGAVTTYAGIGIPAFSDGAVAGAAFHRPTSIAVDASANILYVVDTNNHAIRKIDLTANTVLTIAGGPPSTPAPGSADGLGTLSRFNSPLAIAFDRVTSNLFVADSGNNTIRKITPLTAVTTLAGLAGSAGTADGVGTSARFRAPAGLTASNSIMYVSDTGNHTIRRIASNASVTTYGGFPGIPGLSNAVGTFARFNSPARLFLDVSGSLYIADTGNNAIRKMFATGEVTTYAGVGTIGNANGLSTVASFYGPTSVFGNSVGTVFVADTQNNTIRIITPTPDVRPSGSRVPGTVIVATETYPVSIFSRLEMVTASPPIIGSNLIQLYQYEPYTYVVRKNRPGDSIRATASSVEINFTTTASDVSFASLTGYPISFSYPLQFIVEAFDVSGVVDTLSNTVFVSPGRWSLSQTPPYLFHRGESIGTSFTFSSGTPITQAFVTPSLPVGLTFTQDPCSTQLYRLLGTPLLQTASSNYTFVGRGTGGRIITTSNVTMRVDAERLLLTGGPSNVVGMSVGTAISPVTFTCSTPSTNTNLFQFLGDPLPDGITYADASGTPVTLPYQIANGIPKIITIQGAPTQAAATSFQNSATNRLYTSNVRIRASLGTLTTEATVGFSFGPTVLFTSQYNVSFGPKLFVGIPLLSNIIYKAATFFSNTSNTITSITASSLPAGLSLNFISDASGAYLTGTPTTELASPALYTFTATDSGGNVVSISSDIPVVQNTVTFDYAVTPLVDTSFSFIQSRSLSNAKSGYYTEPIRFKTSSLAGFATTFTLTGLEGSGITLSNSGDGIALLTGVPTTTAGIGTVTIGATDGNASASTTIRVEILPDVYTFNTLTASQLGFLQNRTIVPLQISADTLSERAVQTYSSLDIPPGLTLSPRGRLSGTPTGATGGTFTVTATNGVSSGTATYTYTVVPDSVLILSAANTLQLTPGETVGPFNIDGLSYSGRTVSNFVFSNLSPTYGLTLTSTPGVGILGGLLTNSLPPNVILPPTDEFQIFGTAGSVDGSANFALTTSNSLVYRTFVSWYNDPLGTSLIASDGGLTSWSVVSPLTGGLSSFVSDLQVQTTNPIDFNSNVFLLMDSQSKNVSQSVDGRNFKPTGQVVSIYSLVYNPGADAWFGSGEGPSGTTGFTSDSNGLSWTEVGVIPISGRQSGGYGTGGTIVRYGSNVLMAGGGELLGNQQSIVRSTDNGTTWSAVTGGFMTETWDFSLDRTRWIAVGSDGNSVDAIPTPTNQPAGNTILYSDDLGQTWNAAAGGYSYSGISVMSGSNGWVSTGINYVVGGYESQIKYSSNGTAWTTLDLGVTLPFSASPPGPWPAGFSIQRYGPVYCNGDVWNIIVSYRDAGVPPVTRVYQHDVSTDLGTGWVASVDISSQFDTGGSTEPRFTNLLGPLYIPQVAPFATTITYTDLSTVGGPTFTSPTQTDYIVYQYIPITPITVAAGVTTRLFIRDEDLPVGLVFNTLTGVISGRPIELGERQRVPIYARDAAGISVLFLTFTVLVPRVTRQQSSASAYTSLVQQYTIVNSAQNARDNRALPTELRTLGSFMSPDVPDVTTQDSNPNCVKKNC